MAIMRRKGLALALGLATLGALAVAQAADGSHPRPKGATPMRFALVPAYDQCAAPNRTHGPSLAFPSCFPPAPASDFLTVGTPDADGAAANSAGFMRVDVHPGAPGPPSDTDVLIKLQVSDVRCKAGTSTCGNANVSGGPDYTGELQGNATIRITDDFNAATAGGGTDPATLIDIPMPVNAVCSNTADTSIGASCAISSSTQPLIPDPCGCEGKRMVVEFTQIRVDDGGADGRVATGGNTRFLSEGLFVP